MEGRRLDKTVTAQKQFCTAKARVNSEFYFVVRRTGFARPRVRAAFSTSCTTCEGCYTAALHEIRRDESSVAQRVPRLARGARALRLRRDAVRLVGRGRAR